jgi:hypothetical protein
MSRYSTLKERVVTFGKSDYSTYTFCTLSFSYFYNTKNLSHKTTHSTVQREEQASWLMAVVVNVPSADWLILGLELVSFSNVRETNHKTNLRRFAAHFGACPEMCSAIFVDLQTTQIAASRITKPQVFYLLMALNWLKTYPTEHQIAVTFKVDEKTVRSNVWKYIWAIQALKGMKVRVQTAETESLNAASVAQLLTQYILCLHFL